jgi:hypothetical protein
MFLILVGEYNCFTLIAWNLGKRLVCNVLAEKSNKQIEI